MKKRVGLILTMLLILALPILAWGAPKKRVSPPTRRAAPPDSQMVLMARYLKTVYDQVIKNWDAKKIPLMKLHQRHAVAQLIINKQGRLIKFRLTHSSGVKLLDRTLIKAIKRANPFPPPAPVLRKLLITDGLEIAFRRRVFRKKLYPLKTKYRGTAVVPNWRPRVDGQRKPKKR